MLILKRCVKKENLYCYVDSAAREILSVWERQREGERKREKSRGECGKNRQEKDSKCVLG